MQPSSTIEAKQQLDNMRKDISALPNVFPGSVGLSNPPGSNRPQMPPSPELKRKFSGDNAIKKSTRSQRSVVENTIQSVSTDSFNNTKPQIFSTTAQIVRFSVRLSYPCMLLCIHQSLSLASFSFCLNNRSKSSLICFD